VSLIIEWTRRSFSKQRDVYVLLLLIYASTINSWCDRQEPTKIQLR